MEHDEVLQALKGSLWYAACAVVNAKRLPQGPDLARIRPQDVRSEMWAQTVDEYELVPKAALAALDRAVSDFLDQASDQPPEAA